MVIKLTIFFAIAILFLMELAAIVIDRLKISRAISSGEEQYYSTELSWLKSIKHTVVMYAAPIIILALPFLVGETPTLNDVFQSVTVYLTLNYLKNLYWR